MLAPPSRDEDEALRRIALKSCQYFDTRAVRPISGDLPHLHGVRPGLACAPNVHGPVGVDVAESGGASRSRNAPGSFGRTGCCAERSAVPRNNPRVLPRRVVI